MGRISAIDSIRVLAILAVFTLHSRLFRTETILASWEVSAEIWLDHLSRFAVPFFFFVAGFLFERNRKETTPIDRAVKQAKRLLLLYLVWTLVLSLLDLLEMWARGDVIPWNPGQWPDKLIYGVRMHLWFLPALMQCLLLNAVLGTGRLAGTVVLALYLIGLFGGSYGSLTGVDLGVWSRNSVFFGSVFIWAGRRAAINDSPRPSTAFILVLVGTILHGLEIWFLHYVGQQGWLHERINYLFGTLLVGIGFGRFVLTIPTFGEGTWLPKLGQYTLGIYIIHLDVMSWLQLWFPVTTISSQLRLIVLSFVVCMVLVLILSRCKPLRKWLM